MLEMRIRTSAVCGACRVKLLGLVKLVVVDMQYSYNKANRLISKEFVRKESRVCKNCDLAQGS